MFDTVVRTKFYSTEDDNEARQLNEELKARFTTIYSE